MTLMPSVHDQNLIARQMAEAYYHSYLQATVTTWPVLHHQNQLSHSISSSPPAYNNAQSDHRFADSESPIE